MAHADDLRVPETQARDSASRTRPSAAPQPVPAEAAPWGSGAGRFLLTALIALACGLGGAYLYERFLAPGTPPTVTDASNPGRDVPNPEANANTDANRVTERIDRLSERLDELKKREDDRPPAPGVSDLPQLQVRVADLAQATDNLAPLPGKLDHVANRVSELSSALQVLREDVLAMQSRSGYVPRHASSSPAPLSNGPPASIADVRRNDSVKNPAPPPPPAPTHASGATGAPGTRSGQGDLEKTLAEGVDLYQKGKYKDALEVFDRLELTHPDDARVWYYAALSNGFTSGDWTVGTVNLVERGIAREEAGTPDSTKIDASFKNLTTASGKDWLSAYRKRVNRPNSKP